MASTEDAQHRAVKTRQSQQNRNPQQQVENERHRVFIKPRLLCECDTDKIVKKTSKSVKQISFGGKQARVDDHAGDADGDCDVRPGCDRDAHTALDRRPTLRHRIAHIIRRHAAEKLLTWARTTLPPFVVWICCTAYRRPTAPYNKSATSEHQKLQCQKQTSQQTATLVPDRISRIYCRNVVPQQAYVSTFIFGPALCFILVYICGLTVRNKRISYVMLCYESNWHRTNPQQLGVMEFERRSLTHTALVGPFVRFTSRQRFSACANQRGTRPDAASRRPTWIVP